MKYGNLVIEKKEYVLLKRLMNLSGYYKDETFRMSVNKLLCELETANIMDDAEMPYDLVRFNSVVTIGSKKGWKRTFQVVLPKESNVKEDKISISTPMGAAVMGYAEGDSIVWEFPSGEQHLTIEKVVQEKKHIKLDIVL